MGDDDEREAYRYNCAVFALFGDPSMRCMYSWFRDERVRPAVPRLLRLAGPLDTLSSWFRVAW